MEAKKDENIYRAHFQLLLPLFNLKNIKRSGPILFSGVPSYMVDSVAEHSFKVALLAYYFSGLFSKHEIPVREKELVVAAIFHDLSEIILGDVPSGSPSWKSYFTEDIRTIFKKAHKTAFDTIKNLFSLQGVDSFPPKIELSKDEKNILELADITALLSEIIMFKVQGLKYDWFNYVWSNTLERMKRIIEENSYTFLKDLPEALDGYFKEGILPTNPYLTKSQFQTYRKKENQS